MDELLSLTDDELNTRAARALGWDEISGSQLQRLWRNGDKVMPKDAWIPTSSLDQAFRLQDEVEKRGETQRHKFGFALMRALVHSELSGVQPPGETLWALANASARTRTIAAVYALEGGK